MATTILDLNGSLPQTFTAGNWPRTTFNSGKWRFVWTPTAANTNGAWAGFTAMFTANDLGGLWVNDDKIELYNQSEVAVFSRALTWGAGAVITITIDVAGSQLTVSGASTGNGTTSFTPSGTYFTDTSLGVGVYAGGGFNLPASAIGDVDDGNDSIAGTGSPVVHAPTTAGAGTVAIAGTGTPSVPAPTTAGAGTVAVAGTGALEVPAPTTAGAGDLVIAGTGSPEIPAPTTTGEGSAEDAIAGTGAPEIPSPTMAGAGTLALAGTSSAVVPPPTTSGASAVAIAGTGSPTVPAPATAGAGALAITGTGTPTIPPPTTSNAASFALGAYGAARQLFGAAATSATVTLDTQATGSTIIVCTGGRLTDLANAPTDNKGNTGNYVALGSAEEYADWPGYGVRMWRCIGASGGAGHAITQSMTIFDEVTICAVEVIGGAFVIDHEILERGEGASAASPGGSATNNAHIIAFWSGDAPTGATADITPDGGFSILDETTLVDHPNGYVPIAILHALKEAPGTYATNVAVSPTQGAIIGIVVVQATDEAASTPAGTGAPTIPPPTTSGAGTLAIAGSGAAAVPAPATSGSGALALTGTGAPAVPAPTSTGAGALPVAGTGSAIIDPQAAAGVGTLAIAGAGSLAVQAVTSAGAGASEIAATGAAVTPVPTATGAGTVAIAGAGSPVIDGPAIAATGSQTSAGTGSLVVALPTTSGSGSLSIAGAGAPVVVPPATAGSGALALAGSGSPVVPPPVTAGAGGLAIAGTGSPAVPLPTATATGQLGVTAGALAASLAIASAHLVDATSLTLTAAHLSTASTLTLEAA